MKITGLISLRVLAFLLLAPVCWAGPSSPSVAVHPAPTNTMDTVETLTAELTRMRAEQQKAWATINANNPFSSGLSPGGVQAGTGPFAQINHLLSQPAIQAYMRFFNSPAFSKGYEQVVHSPNRMMLLYSELGLFVLLLILRAWRYSKCVHWAAKLWVRIWTLGLFWICAIVVVPWVVLGDPYYQVLVGAIDVFSSYARSGS